jgi:membrane-bound lytic murein transglycosylase D
MSFVEKQNSIGKKVTVTPSVSIIKEYPADAEFITYTVKKGDTFWEIAKKFDGVSETDIMQLNKINDARSLSYGQVLRIKPKNYN